jgi:hypothetical protein
VSVQSLLASVWPPQGTPAPVQAIPTYDPSGALSKLTINLFYGQEWVFESGNLAAPVIGGFVALPASIPLTLVSPTRPIAAGPTNAMQTFTSSNPGSLPVTLQSRSTISQSIASINATLALTDNGISGFPVPPSTGPYQATVQASDNTGQEIFCASFSLANLSFVETPASSITLSSSLNPAVAGQAITLTATVTSNSGVPAGNVEFDDGTTVLGTAPVDAGHAALTTPLSAGTHNLTATFNGTGGFAGSTSTSPVVVQTMILPTPTLDDRALLMLAIALSFVGAIMLRRS